MIRKHRQLKKIRKIMYEQNKKFNKEKVTIEKNQLKSVVREVKSSIRSFNSRLDHMEESVNSKIADLKLFS